MEGINHISKSANRELRRSRHRILSNNDLKNIKTILDTWFPKSLRISDRIIVSSDPVIIAYRMSLGSVYYESGYNESGIRIGMLANPASENFDLAMQFLKSNYPQVLSQWLDAKDKTERHLERIAGLWQKYILNSVDDIIINIKRRAPSLVIYEGGGKTPESYLVKTNTVKTLHDEIYHFVETGEWLEFFRINRSQKHVGNGYTYLKSPDLSLLSTFVDLVNNFLHDEKMLDDFKSAEMGKVGVEAQVLKLKNSISRIARTL